MKLALLVLAVLLIGIASAASDSDIMNFAKGAVAGNEKCDIGIGTDTLYLTPIIDTGMTQSPSDIGFKMWYALLDANKIVNAYPNRFKYVHIDLFRILDGKYYRIGNATVQI